MIASPTPFQPQSPTASAATPTSRPTAAPSPLPPALRSFYGIDLGDSQKAVTIEIIPREQSLNGGKPILISFLPAKTCDFGDHRGCVFSYRGERGANIELIAVHSGVGGEAQALRHALEGTGLNQAALTLRQIQSNLRALAGAEVKIKQGATVVSGLIVANTGRVPAARLDAYFRARQDQALAHAAGIDSALQAAVNPSTPELVIETCGWKVKEEPWAQGVTSTTASVYLAAIRKAP